VKPLPDSLRIAFFGLPLAGYLLARDGHDLCFAALSPVSAPGLRRLRRTIGAERVLEAGLLGEQFEARVEERLRRERPDLVVSWFFTRKLPAKWLEGARLGGIGAHPSLLPRHRGPNPYFWAIDAGDAETGVSVHVLTPEYDEGDVLAVRRIPVGEKSSWQLARALDRPSLSALRDVVAQFARGESPPRTPQDERSVTWANEPDEALLRADFRGSTERVLRRIRALSPVPGLALEIEGLRLIVTRARKADAFTAALVAGEAAVSDGLLVLRTGDGAVVVERAVVEEADDEQILDAAALGARVGEHLGRG
jgi:methionyl-tRNA formyltransferase